MKNNENYKKSMDKIHASSELKNKTLEKMVEPKNETTKIYFWKYLAACAVFVMVLAGGVFIYNTDIPALKGNSTSTTLANNKLPRFQNIEELKKVCSSNKRNYVDYGYDIVEEATVKSKTNISSSQSALNDEERSTSYSKTNVQVENVDEADIVKTDGKYIYYVNMGSVYIVDAKKMETVSIVEVEDDEEILPKEIYITKDKLVVLGDNFSNSYYYDDDRDDESRNMTYAVVYDITNIDKPKKIRTVSLDGNYSNSRLIGDNLYFISQRYAYYTNDIEDTKLLPAYSDSVNNNDLVTIKAEDIAYFRGTKGHSYMLIAGFNISDNEDVCIETIYGASDFVYASENNLYIVQEKYSSLTGSIRSVIYKFKLNDSNLELLCEKEIAGELNNQFSMDEYDGNLRVATTSDYGYNSKNQLYVLDENLQQIGKISNLAVGEEIYSVRFMGKVGYVVTFVEMDPLFVIDLSDPTNPKVKGELKIPGYSSYLHPYDETHIIGIGRNVKETGFGGVTNTNMKMSMFDVSDLENPKEMFSIDIGDDYTTSSVLDNHKTLFYNKDEDLIGFFVSNSSYGKSYKSEGGFRIYKIDLNKGFSEYGIIKTANTHDTIDRIIYIGNDLFTLSSKDIVKYDLKDFEEKAKLKF